MNGEILKALSKDDLLAVVLAQQAQTEAQAAQIGALTARSAELEARLDAAQLGHAAQGPEAEPSGAPEDASPRSPRRHPRAGGPS